MSQGDSRQNRERARRLLSWSLNAVLMAPGFGCLKGVSKAVDMTEAKGFRRGYLRSGRPWCDCLLLSGCRPLFLRRAKVINRHQRLGLSWFLK